MKTTIKDQTVYYYLRILILFVLTAGISSCAQKAAFMQSSVVPAAEGKVKVKEDDNGNYKIKVDVSHLAQVRKVYSRNYEYVVWMETAEGRTENLGQLKSSSGFFTGQLNASLETITTSEPVQVFITAEREPNTRVPNNEVVLRTRRF